MKHLNRTGLWRVNWWWNKGLPERNMDPLRMHFHTFVVWCKVRANLKSYLAPSQETDWTYSNSSQLLQPRFHFLRRRLCASPKIWDWINLWAITWSGNVLLLMTTGKHSVECILLLKVPEHAGSQRRHADFNSLTFQSTWLCGVCGLLPESRESKGSGRKGRAVVESGICRSHSFFSTVSTLLERPGSSWLVLVSFCVSFLPKNLYQKPTPPQFF